MKTKFILAILALSLSIFGLMSCTEEKSGVTIEPISTYSQANSVTSDNILYHDLGVDHNNLVTYIILNDILTKEAMVDHCIDYCKGISFFRDNLDDEAFSTIRELALLEVNTELSLTEYASQSNDLSDQYKEFVSKFDAISLMDYTNFEDFQVKINELYSFLNNDYTIQTNQDYNEYNVGIGSTDIMQHSMWFWAADDEAAEKKEDLEDSEVIKLAEIDARGAVWASVMTGPSALAAGGVAGGPVGALTGWLTNALVGGVVSSAQAWANGETK